MADYSVSEAPGTALSYFGYEFEVPWNARFKLMRSGNGIVALKFESGQILTFIVPTNQEGLLNEIVQDKSLNMQKLASVFGDLTNRSAYDQYAAVLDTTPQSIRAFGSRAEAVRGIALLTIKSIVSAPGLATGAFSFEMPDKRGFEIGDPRKSRRVDLEVFGMGDHYVEIECGTLNDNVWLSQPELNRILTTIHPVPEKSLSESPVRVTASRTSR